MVGFNINQQNGIFLAGGILAYMFAGKLGPAKGIAKIGGLAAAALGAADVLGIFPLGTITSKIPGYPFGGYGYASSGAYATNNVLPYLDYPERY